MSTIVDERVTDEVEALEAILMEDVKIKRDNGVPVVIETVVNPSTGDDTDQQFVCVTLEVKLGAGYPDCAPSVALRNPRGLDDQLLFTLHSQIKEKLNACLGQPVVFELIELIRESLTKSNLPSGHCVICLFDFVEGDIFTKTECYHYFHNHCLATHFIASKKYYYEELEKLPIFQKTAKPPYVQNCPLCSGYLTCDVEALLKNAPPPVDSINAPPFVLTPELRALQQQFSELLAKQRARGGVVGAGDAGPPPLTITTPADTPPDPAPHPTHPTQPAGVPEPRAEPAARLNGNSSADATTDETKHYRGPYRGFNRRGKPGRRGRGAR